MPTGTGGHFSYHLLDEPSVAGIGASFTRNSKAICGNTLASRPLNQIHKPGVALIKLAAPHSPRLSADEPPHIPAAAESCLWRISARPSHTCVMELTTDQRGSFLLRFQEEHSASDGADILCATSTMTKTMEEPDQDPDRRASIVCATSTFTATIEDPDQDPRLLATQTMTETSEAPDQDPQRADYFAIPRA